MKPSISLLALLGSLVLFGCAGNKPAVSAEFNRAAALVGQLPANPLQWKVISSAIDSRSSTMSTLYGNDLAVAYARTNPSHDYPAGAILALVIWAQAEDPRWFGAKIPAQVKSVEFLTISDAPQGHRLYSYRKFEGTPLQQSAAEQGTVPSARSAYLLSQRAAVMP